MKKQRRASALVGGLVVGMVIGALAKEHMVELALDCVELYNGKYGFEMPCNKQRRHSEPDVRVYPPCYKSHISR